MKNSNPSTTAKTSKDYSQARASRNKTEVVWVRLTPEEKERVVTDAKAMNLTTTAYIIRCIRLAQGNTD